MAAPTPQERARLALAGLSVGDAFGEKFFRHADDIAVRRLPPAPWPYTDDTAMACSIVEVLERFCTIDQDELAKSFAGKFMREPWRGYGAMAERILSQIASGQDWREVSGAAFEGAGSLGNGSAMRVAPLGAFFCHDLSLAAAQAGLSAAVTHAHPEGISGAMAVAVAAASACRLRGQMDEGRTIIEAALTYTPPGETRRGIQQALELPLSAPVEEAVHRLGNGSRVTTVDTVPFCLWCAARHLGNYEEALWTTVAGLGDRDTTCAIVGGIVALSTGLEGIPAAWLAAREPLDSAPRGR